MGVEYEVITSVRHEIFLRDVVTVLFSQFSCQKEFNPDSNTNE